MLQASPLLAVEYSGRAMLGGFQQRERLTEDSAGQTSNVPEIFSVVSFLMPRILGHFKANLLLMCAIVTPNLGVSMTNDLF